MSGISKRLAETYVKVGRDWKYLYRAGDSDGQTIEFMPSARRDVFAAERFFKKLTSTLLSQHNPLKRQNDVPS